MLHWWNGMGRNQRSLVQEITPSFKSLDVWPSTLLWRKKSLYYRNIPYCHWSWMVLLLLWASEDNFHSSTWISAVFLYWPFALLCCFLSSSLLNVHWQCKTDRKVNDLKWASLFLSICTCAHKCSTYLVSPRVTFLIKKTPLNLFFQALYFLLQMLVPSPAPQLPITFLVFAVIWWMNTECSGLPACIAHLNPTFLSTDWIRCPRNAPAIGSLGVQFGRLVGSLGGQSVMVRACQNQSSFLPENLTETSGEHN